MSEPLAPASTGVEGNDVISGGASWRVERARLLQQLDDLGAQLNDSLHDNAARQLEVRLGTLQKGFVQHASIFLNFSYVM